MHSGLSTIPQVLEALAEATSDIPGIKVSTADAPTQIKETPTLLYEWFSDVDADITTGSTQMWIAPVRATLYFEAIKGNPPETPIKACQDLIHPIVDRINQHPDLFPWGSKMSQLEGVDRTNVVRVRPAEFGLTYAGHRYFGATFFIEIKLHRRINR